MCLKRNVELVTPFWAPQNPMSCHLNVAEQTQKHVEDINPPFPDELYLFIYHSLVMENIAMEVYGKSQYLHCESVNQYNEKCKPM